MIFDSSSGKIVVAFADESNSFQGTARVGTVNASNNTISFGTPLVYNSAAASTTKEMVADTSANRIVLVSTDLISGSYKAVARVGTITGTTISFSSPQEIYSGNSSGIGVGFDSTNNKVVVVYQNNNQAPDAYRLNTLVGTVNAGTNTIAFGSRQTLLARSGINKKSVVYDSGSQKILFVYRNGNNSWIEEYRYATVNAGTDTITLDSATVLNTVDNGYAGAVYDPNANQALIHYQDYSNSRYGTYHVVGLAGFPVHQLSSPIQFESGSTENIATAYDSTNNRVVIAYRDASNSHYGTAVVGTVSGTGISFGTPTIFNSGTTVYTAAEYDASNSRVVIAYVDYGNSDQGTAIVGAVDPTDNSIEFGAESLFNAASTHDIGLAYDSVNGKIIVAYDNYGQYGNGQAKVGTVDTNDNSITFGSVATFNGGSNDTDFIDAIYDSANSKVVITYRNKSNSYKGTAIVGTVNSDDTISFSGAANAFGGLETIDGNYYGAPYILKTTYDSTNGKVVVYYNKIIKVGTVNASNNTIAFGSGVVNTAPSDDAGRGDITYDSDAQKVIISYRDYGNSNYGTIITGSVSGTSITLDSPIVFETAETNDASQVYDSSSRKTVVAYRDGGNSYDGRAVIFSPRTISTNLTSENFIGISDGAYSDGQTATIQIAGAVDDAQSGLTPGQQYYVQNDGTLSETADNPSVLAGTAVAATKLIIG